MVSFITSFPGHRAGTAQVAGYVPALALALAIKGQVRYVRADFREGAWSVPETPALPTRLNSRPHEA